MTGVDTRSPASDPVAAENLAVLTGDSRFRLVAANVTSTDLALLLEGVDVVFHMAALPGVRRSWGDRFADYLACNVLATQRLLEPCGVVEVPRLVFASSSSVYGQTDSKPSRETDPLCPSSPYGVSKLAAERLCLAYSPLRQMPSVAVCEAALAPSPGAVSLLFPVADADIDGADPVRLAAAPRPLPLVYIGNQYDRDEAFSAFFAPVAARFEHRVAGKWTHTADWPHVRFTGRCPFPHVRELYESALATVLLLPERYARAGQMTQRLFEAVLVGCLPITPATISSAADFTPPALHAATGQQAANRVAWLLDIAGTARHAELIAACLDQLSVFRLSRQLRTLDRILRRLTDDSSACPHPSAAAGR